jgi:hypothetical protein
MLGGHEARKDLQAAAADLVVVKAAAKVAAAVLGHVQAPPLRPERRDRVLEHQGAVGDALHLQVTVDRRQVIENQHRAMAPGEVLREGEKLASVAQRAAGEQTQFRQ